MHVLAVPAPSTPRAPGTDDPPMAVSMPPRAPLPGSGLHVCPVCHGDFVHREYAQAEGAGRQRLGLRCGECGAERDVVVSDDLARRVGEDMARGREMIARALPESAS